MKRRSLGQRLRELFSGGAVDEEFQEELEDILLEADLGAAVAMDLADRIGGGGGGRDAALDAVAARLRAAVAAADLGLDPARFNVVLVLGVNGVGKTTTIAKLAHLWKRTHPDAGLVLAAGDTFRAAAVEQLATHAARLGVRIVRQGTGADAAAVIYDALESARARGDRLVLADTAGRMHTRKDLVGELGKIEGIVRRFVDEQTTYRRILVVDASTGQNALRQAELFHEAVGVDAVVLSKYDGSGRGGVLVQIHETLGIGCAYLGTGEGYDDLETFDPAAFADALVGR